MSVCVDVALLRLYGASNEMAFGVRLHPLCYLLPAKTCFINHKRLHLSPALCADSADRCVPSMRLLHGDGNVSSVAGLRATRRFPLPCMLATNLESTRAINAIGAATPMLVSAPSTAPVDALDAYQSSSYLASNPSPSEVWYIVASSGILSARGVCAYMSRFNVV